MHPHHHYIIGFVLYNTGHPHHYYIIGFVLHDTGHPYHYYIIGLGIFNRDHHLYFYHDHLSDYLGFNVSTFSLVTAHGLKENGRLTLCLISTSTKLTNLCAYPWSTTVLASNNFGDLFAEGEFGKVRSQSVTKCSRCLMRLVSGIHHISAIFLRQAIHSLLTPLNGLASG